MKILLLSTLLSLSLISQNLEQLAGSMLMVGFFGTEAPPNSQICKDIKRYHLAGVILFDRDPTNPKRAKNISSKTQLKRLTRELKACSYDGKLLIAVDQEGGVVQRLKNKYGFFGKFPKAIDVPKKGQKYATEIYTKMAKELKQTGINYDLAPVIDLAINPKNRVIYALGRSFGKSPEVVTKYASIFIQEMHRYGIITSLKHFPGHGSSLGDTHKGFVDVSNLWSKKELIPYKRLTQKGIVDTVMVAHIFNKHIDPKYPASLSKKTVDILRRDIRFRGVVITDDLQMGAISKHYSLKERIRLAINAGDDILLFGNQLDSRRIYPPKLLVESIISLIREKKIDIKRLEESNRRLSILKRKIKSSHHFQDSNGMF